MPVSAIVGAVAKITATAGIKALHIHEADLDHALYMAQRLEGQLADLVADLRDTNSDWRETQLTNQMASLHEQQRQWIGTATNALRDVTGLRQQLGLEEHVLTRVYRGL